MKNGNKIIKRKKERVESLLKCQELKVKEMEGKIRGFVYLKEREIGERENRKIKKEKER